MAAPQDFLLLSLMQYNTHTSFVEHKATVYRATSYRERTRKKGFAVSDHFI